MKKEVLTLIILAPAISELLSGSTPLKEFIQPPMLIILVGTYGLSALAIREIWIRLNGSVESLFTLGLAFGVIVEGFITNSFYNPRWHDLSLLANYGRVWGINTVWMITLMSYHAIYSIFLPITIVNLKYKSQTPWLGKKRLTAAIFISLLFVLAMRSKLSSYQPPQHLTALSLLLIASFILISAMIKGPKRDREGLTCVKSYLYGLTLSFSWFTSFYYLPKKKVNPLIDILTFITIWIIIYGSTMHQKIRAKELSAAICGFLTLLIFISIPQTKTGGTIIGIIAAILMVAFYRSIGKAF